MELFLEWMARASRYSTSTGDKGTDSAMNLATGLAPPLAGVGLARESSLVALQMIVPCMYISVNC